MIFTVFAKAQSSKVWSKLERELRFEAKPRAGALIWSQTSSGSSVLEQNLEPELMFGAKPRAGAHSGSAERSMLCTVLSKAQVSKSMVFTVFLHV